MDPFVQEASIVIPTTLVQVLAPAQPASPGAIQLMELSGGERAGDSSARPAPLLALDDAEHESGHRDCEEQRSREVRKSPATGRTALDEMAP
jgi:hypothetical protein